MHRDPYSENPMMRAWPSDRAKAARDKWIADQGGEDAIRRRIAGGTVPGTRELDYLVLRWHVLMTTKGAERLRSAIADERLRDLRRARRQLRLALTVCGLAVGSALALVVWYGILGHH